MDCEQPPTVTHATVKISDDENDDLVSATYSCKDGFTLQGEAELFCDLNTDEWQGEPPHCKKGKKIYFCPALLTIFNYVCLKATSIIHLYLYNIVNNYIILTNILLHLKTFIYMKSSCTLIAALIRILEFKVI